MSNCPICDGKATLRSPGGFDGEEVSCPRCGDYKINGTAKAILESATLSEQQKAIASGWIRDHQDDLITPQTIEKLKVLRMPTVVEKANYLLGFLVSCSPYFGVEKVLSKLSILYPSETEKEGDLDCRMLMGISRAVNNSELEKLIEYLEAEGLITSKRITREYMYVCVTAKGFSYIERMKTTSVESDVGFCAMWFDDSVNPLWDKAIEPAIRKAGYQPLRIDKKEHVNRIDDEIFADIRRSRFVVADFTHDEKGVRGGVYFEAGFAQGLGLRVIWTCRKDMLSEDKLHFDIRQYNFLEWSEDNLDDFKNCLQKRIEAILGRGSWKSE